MNGKSHNTLRFLHLHSTFDAGGKERRTVALMNRFHRGVEHHIVSAQPGAMGAKGLIDKRVAAYFPFGFPPLAGKLRIARLGGILPRRIHILRSRRLGSRKHSLQVGTLLL